jgi:hypothetical protein
MFNRNLIRNIRLYRYFSTLEKNPISNKIFNTINPFTLGMTCFGFYCLHYIIYDSYLQEQNRNNKVKEIFKDENRN